MGKTLNETPNERLMRVLQFNENTLVINQSGLLTDEQKRRIWRWQVIQLVTIWTVVAGPITLLILGVSHNHLVSSSTLEMMHLFFVLFHLPILAAVYWHQRRTLFLLRRGRVTIISGKITRQYEPQGRSLPSIILRDKRLEVSTKVYDAFKDGEIYTLCYVPELDLLISAEHHTLALDLVGPRRRPKSHPLSSHLKWE